MKHPTPAEIIKARKDAGLTQSEAAALVYAGYRAWQCWEAPEESKAHREMPPGLFELFLIKTKV